MSMRKHLKTSGIFLVVMVLVASYFIFYASNKVAAISTVGSATSALQGVGQRKMVRSSNGTLVYVYTSGTAESPNGLVFRKSTDNAASWSASTQISASAFIDYDIAKDSADNIYVAYNSLVSGTISVIKLTYSAGNWTAGGATAVLSKTTCSGVVNGNTFSFPSIAINTSDVLVISAYDDLATAGSCGFPVAIGRSSRSTDGSSWGAAYASPGIGITAPQSVVAIGSDLWTVGNNNGTVYKDIGTTGAWTSTGTTVSGISGSSSYSICSAGSDQINIGYTSSGIKYDKYTISSNLAAGATTISAGASDLFGNITCDSSAGEIWMFYRAFVGASSYNVVYKHFAAGWDVGATSITTDNLNNNFATSTQQRSGGVVGIGWNLAGTPNTIKSDALVSANTAPGAPTLSSPASGATINTTLNQSFQMSATDSQSDTLKYQITIYNTTAQSGGNCTGSSFENRDQNSDTTGWSQAGAYASGATATYSNQSAFTLGSSYCWQARAKDPSGSNTFGNWSTPSTFTVDAAPAAPTLISPASSATQIPLKPVFQLRTSDADNDYLKYKINVYQSNCSTLVRTIDQSSQTGWSGQDQQTSTAYTGNSSVSSSTIATYAYQYGDLLPNTAYCWSGAATDPGGSNGYGSTSSTQTFTTATFDIRIISGTTIKSGVTFH